MASINEADSKIVGELESMGDRLEKVRDAIGKVIFGQDEVIELALTAILGGGHALLVGAPGLAKTKLATSLGRVLGLEEKRVQFTPDLMPADILGSEVLEESETGRRQFRFVPGPVFCQLLMADEINRASPRTQSALLQAMQEHHVTVAGVRHDLPRPFHVLATQNPIEQEGTYPLPEAQLDRFLLEIDVPYPALEAERRMLFATTGNDEQEAEKVLTTAELLSAQRLTRAHSGGRAGGRSHPARSCAPRGPVPTPTASSTRMSPGDRSPARQPGADAGRPRPRPAARPAVALDRRCAGAGRRRSSAIAWRLNFTARAEGDSIDSRHRPAQGHARLSGAAA